MIANRKKNTQVFPSFSNVSSTRLPRPRISLVRFRNVESSNFAKQHNFNIHDIEERKVEEVSHTLDIDLKF